jgi:MiaB-like tRNA modifying enzyme
MLAHLMSAGYRLTYGAASADVILINTCAVKKPTEDRIVEKIRVLSQLNKPLIVAGCLPKINFKAVLKAAPDLSAVLDPRSVDKILLAVKSAERGEKSKIFFSQKPVHKLRQPKIRLNPSVEIISISEGCVGACAFCCVRFARGALFSYPKEDIVKRVSHAVSEGVKEFWFTSQDNGAYGLDIKTNLAELLEDCCRVEGKFLIRVGMMNPDHVPWKLPELIDAYKNEKIFKFLHLPVQSGDNETLTRMNRRYTVEEFKKIVHKFREKIPETTLSTDIICGFPGESRQAFEETLKLVEEVQPDIVNISKFFSRPHTPAGLMEPIDANEVKDRSRRLTKIARKTSLDRNRTWLNWEGQVFIDEKGRDSSWIGRNFAYKPIAIRSNEYLSGRFIQAKVVEAHPTYLEAEVAENL